jgi:thiamine biosynthesis lipoprotein ApbE
MPLVRRLAVWALAALLGVVGQNTAFATDDFAFFHENVLGTSCELRVRADSEEDARCTEERVLSEVDRLALIFSSYDSSSEFSRWQATRDRPTRLSEELFEVLQASDVWRTGSAGVFDPRVEALSQLWAKAAQRDRLPTPSETSAAQTLMAQTAWRLDRAARTAIHTSACPLSLNAIAKGYIVERASDVALAQCQGVHGLLLNIGGDLRVCGDWARTIGIANPRGDSETTEPLVAIEVKSRSVAASGNYQRGFDIRGRRYSHVFDPRSGMPADRTVGATVIAPRGADADALTKVFSVLPAAESLRLADALHDVACLLVADDGQIFRSSRWATYELPHSAAAALAPLPATLQQPGAEPGKAVGPQAEWEQDLELLIRFEINRPDGDTRRYRRPYLAVWIEDKDGLAVRTLTLWVQAGGRGPRWIPELRRWYRGDQVRRIIDDTNLVDTTARATRLPGKYEVIWDGKDDRGKPLGAGEYRVFIEVAREHGTYQIIQKSLTLAKEPFLEELKGNVEIKSATVAYRRKGSAK